MKIIRRFALMPSIALFIVMISATPIWSQFSRYHTYSDLEKKLKQLANDYSNVIDLQSHGETQGERKIWSVTLFSGKSDLKPAVLIVAGVDGKDLAGTEVSLRFIESLAQNYGKVDSITKMLDQSTYYIFPRVNPDASEALFSNPQYARSLNNRPMDLDNDGSVDEDGYDDLNNDGQITWLRVTEPGGEWFQDKNYPSLLKKADAGKGETGVYRLIREGFDNDGDGLLNEDEPGGVNFNQNFTFRYKYFVPGSGFYQVSEVETRAIADFAFTHPNIAVVFSFSSNDNLNHPWEGAKAPKATISERDGIKPIEYVEQKDLPYFSHISEVFIKLTGLEDLSDSESGQGAFNEWAYYHFGRWSFSTPTWWPPLYKTASDTEVTEKESSKIEMKQALKKPEGDSKKNRDQRLWEWLQATNQQDAFIEWKEINHPDYPDKKVEIGGFKPFAAINPPADSLLSIFNNFYPFLFKLSSWLPRIDVRDLNVDHLHDNVYRLTLNVINLGFLPTNTQIGIKNKWCPKIKIALNLSDKQQLVSGRVLQFIDVLDGSGGSKEVSWMIIGNKGEPVTLEIGSPMTGTVQKNMTLQ
jgi:hypothetical protein